MYGVDGEGKKGYDCVVIPGALKKADNTPLGASRICGSGMGLATGTAAAMYNMPVCCECNLYPNIFFFALTLSTEDVLL